MPRTSLPRSRFGKKLREQLHEKGSALFDSRRRCFISNATNKPVPGLTPKLSELFWPDYKFTKPPKTSKKSKKGNAYGGMTRGQIVHKQLQMITDRVPFKEFKKQYVALNPYTKLAVHALDTWKYEPVVAELAVFDDALGIATAADMLCVDANGKLVLIEWKTGMGTYFHRGNAKMKHVRLVNSPENQALTQLLFTKMILEKDLGIKVDKAFVVHIIDDEVEALSIPATLTKSSSKMYKAMYMWMAAKP